MKMFFALLLWVALATAAAAQPVIPIQVDLQAPQREFRTQWAGGSAPTLAVDIQNGGLPYPEISGWTGFVFVAITPTSGVYVADAGSASNTVFFPFAPVQCATTGTFPAYVILSNGTNLYQFGAGRLTFTDSPALLGAGPINPLIPFNWDLYTFTGTPPPGLGGGSSSAVSRLDSDWQSVTNTEKGIRDWVSDINDFFANRELWGDMNFENIGSLESPSHFKGDWEFENKPIIPGFAETDDLETRMMNNSVKLITNIAFYGAWSETNGVWSNGNGVTVESGNVEVGILFPSVGVTRVTIPVHEDMQFIRLMALAPFGYKAVVTGIFQVVHASFFSGTHDIPYPTSGTTSGAVTIFFEDYVVPPFSDWPVIPAIGEISVWGSSHPDRLGKTNDSVGIFQRADNPSGPRDVANKQYVDGSLAETRAIVDAITPNKVGVTLDGKPVRFSPNWGAQAVGEAVQFDYAGQTAFSIVGGGTVTPQMVSMWLDSGTTYVRVVSSPIWKPHVESSTNYADWFELGTNEFVSTYPHISNSTYVLGWVSVPDAWYRVIATSTNAGDLGSANFLLPVRAPSLELTGTGATFRVTDQTVKQGSLNLIDWRSLMLGTNSANRRWGVMGTATGGTDLVNYETAQSIAQNTFANGGEYFGEQRAVMTWSFLFPGVLMDIATPAPLEYPVVHVLAQGVTNIISVHTNEWYVRSPAFPDRRKIAIMYQTNDTARAGQIAFQNGQFYRCRTNGVWEQW